MIYLHCLPKAITAAGSPLDDVEPMGQVLPFRAAEAQQTRRALA